jgi:hypothetical protein
MVKVPRTSSRHLSVFQQIQHAPMIINKMNRTTINANPFENPPLFILYPPYPFAIKLHCYHMSFAMLCMGIRLFYTENQKVIGLYTEKVYTYTVIEKDRVVGSCAIQCKSRCV